MRPLTLKPYKTPREGASWCLDIPEYLSETGKRQRKFFGTQKEAETAAEILKARRANFGNTLSLLSPERITEAAEVYKLLDSAESHFSLLEVVKSHLRQEKARSASRSFAHLFDLYLADRSEISEEHRYKLGKTKERFPKLRNKMACDITYEDLEPTLHKLKPHMRNAEMRNLNSIFRFGRKRRWLEINPIDQLSFVKIHRKEVETIAASTVEKILLDSLQNDRELLPFLVLAFFCGCRPMGELNKIEWRDVHLNDEHRQVVIRPDVSKTRERRFIDLSENACAWLQEYLNRKGTSPAPSSLIVPFSFHILRKKRRQNWINAHDVATKPVKNGSRHTFCSCWVAKHQDFNKLLLQLGHGTTEMLRKHYHKATTREEAERFWSIFPPKQEETKILAFPAAS